MRRKLDIIDSVPITQHTNYAIPLSIILADAKNLDWFYHHFIQIYSSEKMVGSVKRRIFYCDNVTIVLVCAPFTEFIST